MGHLSKILEKQERTDLTQGQVGKVILRFALPLLVGNLLQQLYNLTDSIIVGQFLGKEALAAVSASFFHYYFIISLIIGIGSGTTVVISQLYGAKAYDKLQKAFSTFFLFMLITSAFQLPLSFSERERSALMPALSSISFDIYSFTSSPIRRTGFYTVHNRIPSLQEVPYGLPSQ